MSPLTILFSVLFVSSLAHGSHHHHHSNNIVPVAEQGNNYQQYKNQQSNVDGDVYPGQGANGQESYIRNGKLNLEALSTISMESFKNVPVQKAVQTFDEISFMTAYNTSAYPTYTPSVEDINLYLITNTGNVSVSMNQPETLVQQPTYDSNRDVVVFVTGFPFNYMDKTDGLVEVLEAYRERQAENLIVYDVGSNLNNLYNWIALDAIKTGELIGQSLVKLAEAVPYYRFHFIGHSTGAHVAGAAARYFYHSTGNRVPRITALDPSRVSYRTPNVVLGLQRGDANFVDAIHTSSFGFGSVQSIGDVDFYPSGPNTLVPGTNNLVSAHTQALRYYAETVVPGGERNFMAVECNSLQHAQESNNQFNHGQEVPLGYATPTTARGNYFLEVNAQKPYGQNYNSRRNSNNYRTNLRTKNNEDTEQNYNNNYQNY